jgi:hypothetical protein
LKKRVLMILGKHASTLRGRADYGRIDEVAEYVFRSFDVLSGSQSHPLISGAFISLDRCAILCRFQLGGLRQLTAPFARSLFGLLSITLNFQPWILRPVLNSSALNEIRDFASNSFLT